MSARARSTIVCDVAALAPDAATVGALARLQLGARRSGFEVVLRGPSQELRELLALVGLEQALRVEPGGQPEEGEELLGVEEERELPDTPV
jgi:ABC-type transporter Mla MlaB component